MSTGTTAWRTAGAWTSTGSGTAWTTMSQAVASLSSSNNAYVQCSISKSGGAAQALTGTNFGFTTSDVPVGAIITGVEVQVERKSTKSMADGTVQLTLNGDPIGSNLATTTAYPTADATVTYGSTTNPWGTAVYEADAKGASFGLIFQPRAANTASTVITIDYIAMRLTWTLNPPVIQTTSTTVMENRALSLALAADKPCSWTIVGGADAGLFAMSGSTLSWASGTRDFENPTDADKNNVYIVNVRAKDAANLTTDATVAVTVGNLVDETPPTITSSGTLDAYEGANASLSLTANETVTWSIAGGADAARFTISGSTLTLPAKDFDAPIDANSDNAYEVIVRASDTSENTTDKLVVFTVQNAPPVITSTTGSVQENKPLAFALTASEAASFAIVGGDDAGFFAMSGSTLSWASGTRDFEAPADADHNNVYSVLVSATDPQGLTSNAVVSITVTDQVDETPPTITSPATGTCDEGSLLSFALAANETVTWSIVGGEDQNAFSLSGSTLTWYANSYQSAEIPLDADKDSTYRVVVRATDATGNYTDQTVAISVNDLAMGHESVVLVSGFGLTSWKVPQGCYSALVECVGASGAPGAAGAGGGAYAASTVALVPGSVIPFQVGAGNSGMDTWFGSPTTVMAKGGGNAIGNAGGIGGQASASVGDVTYSGGNGGIGQIYGGGGGGGSAGPHGDGRNGGAPVGTSAFGASFGGGGGGCDGQSSTAGADSPGNVGGDGGQGPFGGNGGVFGGVAPAMGGGGAGGRYQIGGMVNGQSGSAYPIWQDIGGTYYGVGGGGGGGCRSGAVSGSSPGFGGGAGGAPDVRGVGGMGGIVITFNDDTVETNAPPAARRRQQRHTYFL